MRRKKTQAQIEHDRLYPGDEHFDDDFPMWGSLDDMCFGLHDEPVKVKPSLWQKFLALFK